MPAGTVNVWLVVIVAHGSNTTVFAVATLVAVDQLVAAEQARASQMPPSIEGRLAMQALTGADMSLRPAHATWKVG
jgi:nucleoside-specific outer membrane channel protein Tsx